MTIQHFTTTLLLDQSPEELFQAILDVRGWWSADVEGDTGKLHEVFTYHFKDVHFCRLKITELIPGKKIVWLVMENHFNFTKDKSEWKNNQIIFEITQMDAGSQLHFTQLGLIPEYECFTICRDAWTHYIHNSLRGLITTGKGQPNPKEGGFNQQLLDEYKSNK